MASKNLVGFDLPLTAREDLSNKFPIAMFTDEHEAPLLPTREYTMMELVNRITDKPDWHKKVFDEAITAKWKAETLGDLATNEVNISEKMVDWCISEVKYKAKVLEQTDCIETLDGVWKSDIIVPEDLRLALRKAVAPLENVPEREKDWHPGSNDQVLDLVHPSIYPLVYGQTKILRNETVAIDNLLSWIGKGETLMANIAEGQEIGNEWSKKYQWLPSIFEIPVDTDDVKIASYINNVRPDKHQDLYSIVSHFVAKALPLWNRTLTALKPPFSWAPHIEPRVSDWSNGSQGYDKGSKEPEQEEGEEDDDYYDRCDAWRETRDIIEPEPPTFKTPAQRLAAVHGREIAPPDLKPSVDLRKDFGKLQIIVKLANIHLTPEKPGYGGGSWHVEGQANESICSTALYYYDSENITESRLAFRQRVEAGLELPYEQNDFRAVEAIYGFENEGPAIQELGAVVTREGRLLTFPNTMQHCVHPFKLEDPTKPGHRKILALFLVDPHVNIISTADVPPQQKEWWRELVDGTGVLRTFPQEIQDHIYDSETTFPVSLEKAKEQRLELMDERKEFVVLHNDDFESANSFNLCEH